MKTLNNVLLKIAAISAAICVLALGALFVMSRGDAEERIGAYGTICGKKECRVAIYDGAPGEGEILTYFSVDADDMTEEDFDEYFYLSNKSKMEMEDLGYDVSELSNESALYILTGHYIEGYYYYPAYYNE